MRPARPGDRIDEFLTTKVFNELIKSLGITPTPGMKLGPHVPTTFMGHASAPIEMYAPVGITGVVIPNPDDGELAYNAYYQYPNCNISTSFDNYNLAVVQNTCDVNTPSLCVILGLTWVKANVTDLTHKWLSSNGSSLVSNESKGKAYILIPPESTGVGYCLVWLGMMPTTLQTVVTALRVTTDSVQYKTRNIYVHADAPESDWLDLNSVLCSEEP
jgi:hypothetical protein